MRNKGRQAGIYPELWKSGRCPIRHRLWLECQRNRAQAKFRGQVWEITEEEFIVLWMTDNRYQHRGRRADDLCMTRIRKDESWNKNNVFFPTRKQHFNSLYAGKSKENYQVEYR